jgi:nucleotide-binding universal stress UspA family protein
MRYGRSSTTWAPNLGDMTKLRDRREDISGVSAAPTAARPVLLATLSVRVDPTAERMAIDSAIEAGVPLLLVNLIRLPPYATTIILAGPEHTTLPHEEDLEAVRATANRAAELGVKTELLRVRTKRPVQALLEVASERDAGLIVFGPHLGRVGRMRFRRAARRIRREASCLVWVAPDG